MNGASHEQARLGFREEMLGSERAGEVLLFNLPAAQGVLMAPSSAAHNPID